MRYLYMISVDPWHLGILDSPVDGIANIFQIKELFAANGQKTPH